MIQLEEIDINNFTFTCRVSGNRKNEMVLLLHGFPESSHMWVRIMSEISALGYYCVAPNLRGYSKNARPLHKKEYLLDILKGDVLAIAKQISPNDKFHLIAHDWGAVIGWKLIHDHPDLVLSWTALSFPHLQAFGSAMQNDKEQKKMSRYILMFQIPFLPEIMFRRNDFKVFRTFWENCSDDEVSDYLTVFRDKKGLTAALSYYRSNYRYMKQYKTKKLLAAVKTPTLFIWGDEDFAISKYAAENCKEYVDGYYEFVKISGGHWLIQTHYSEVKSKIIQHLMKYKYA